MMIVIVLLLPLIGLTLSALVPAYGVPLTFATATFENFRFVLMQHGGAARAFGNSILLSLIAALFAVLIAVPLAYMLAWRKRRWTPVLNFAAELPYALPGVVLAIACLLMFLKPLPVIGVSLYNTLWIILFAYLARFFVLALRNRGRSASDRPRDGRSGTHCGRRTFLSAAHDYISSCRTGDACRRRAHFHDCIL